jgi:hypothetical protein
MTTKAATVRAVLYLPGRSAVRSFPSEEAIGLSIRSLTRKWSIFLHLVGERPPQDGLNVNPSETGFGSISEQETEAGSWGWAAKVTLRKGLRYNFWGRRVNGEGTQILFNYFVKRAKKTRVMGEPGEWEFSELPGSADWGGMRDSTGVAPGAGTTLFGGLD